MQRKGAATRALEVNVAGRGRVSAGADERHDLDDTPLAHLEDRGLARAGCRHEAGCEFASAHLWLRRQLAAAVDEQERDPRQRKKVWFHLYSHGNAMPQPARRVRSVSEPASTSVARPDGLAPTGAHERKRWS